ncbi:MAG TPA: ABC transporter permease DevC [Vicinamibacteria bacterium]|nr:ABC transporter permease DevC [Vicinamibacteria bacterium]
MVVGRLGTTNMRAPWALAWSQLVRERARFAMALAGVGFAVILMLVQLGFRSAAFDGAVRLHRVLAAEVVIVHPRTNVLADVAGFPRRRLDQARAVPGVRAVTGVNARLLPWTNLDEGGSRYIFVVGIDPSAHALDLPEVNAQLDRLKLPETVLFDLSSRPEFGISGDQPPRRQAPGMNGGTSPAVEINGYRVQVAGFYRLGISFAIDGTVVTSDLNFLRLVPGHPPGLIEIGLVQLTPGADPLLVRDDLVRTLPPDVRVLTRKEYMDREVHYWDTSMSIGIVFGFGVLVGFGVGAVVVAQILFSDVTDHLDEYATLKAIGFGNRYLYGVVLWEAFFMACLGFVPGVGASALLYRLVVAMTGLPMVFDPTRAGLVLGLTVLMCFAAGLLALRKLETADPAEMFR